MTLRLRIAIAAALAGAAAVVAVLVPVLRAPDPRPETVVLSAGPAEPAEPAAPAAPGQQGGSPYDELGPGPLTASTPQPPQAVPTGAAAGGGAPPVEAGSQYPGFEPRTLTLPSGTVATVRPAGVRADGTLAVPEKVAELGWWTGGARAGEPYGGTVIAGHVDSREQGLGALAELRDVKKGDEVLLRGAGEAELLRYRVVSRRNVPQARLAAGTDTFAQGVPHRLVLVTCGGPFDRTAHRYTENVVVVADPVPLDRLRLGPAGG